MSFGEGYKQGLAKGRSECVTARAQEVGTIRIENTQDVLEHKALDVRFTRLGKDSFELSIPGIGFQDGPHTVFEGGGLAIRVPVLLEVNND